MTEIRHWHKKESPVLHLLSFGWTRKKFQFFCKRTLENQHILQDNLAQTVDFVEKSSEDDSYFAKE